MGAGMRSGEEDRRVSTLAARIAGSALEKLASAIDRFRQLLFQQEWFNSVVMPAIPRSVRWNLRKLYFLVPELIDSTLGKSDDLIPPKSKIFVGTVDFKEGAQQAVDRLIVTDVITPESRVLDVGCGIGRLAIPLTSYLKGGSYDGLDIVPSGIDWCNKHIAPKFRNFRFTLADIYNKEYNPGGHVRAAEYTFPYPDDTFDLVVLISVFTHMLPDDTERYVAEISRVLHPGGRCWATFYILNSDSIAMMDAGNGSLRFKHNHATYWTVNDKAPELSTGYEEDYIKDVFERHGLSLAGGVHYGGWSGRPALWDNEAGNLGDQDLLLATKESRAVAPRPSRRPSSSRL
jgi:SAM-dependent methyltransferase